MLAQIKSTAAWINQTTSNYNPQVGIVLGSGLGNLATQISVEHSIPYEQIPNFPVSTVEGHSGTLVFGKLGGKRVVAMRGRFHYYEGYSMQQVTFPIRVLKLLGINTLILSNASGGVNPDFSIGTMMIQNDHINLFPESPLHGPNMDELGPRFPDMSETYDKNLIAKAKEIANAHNIEVAEGVYVGLSGPCLETPAEYKYVRIIGGDTVGMSTVPEAIVARHMGIPVFAMSIITDLGVPGKIVKVTHEDVQIAASAAEPKMTTIITNLIESL